VWNRAECEFTEGNLQGLDKMSNGHKYFLQLLFLYILLLLSGYLLVSLVISKVFPGDIVILSTVFTLIAGITLIIFFKGQLKDPESQTLYILVAVSLKFLLEIVFALVWFIVAKKTSLASVLMFFVLYLCLSVFSIGVILKTVKNKAL
jgi:hypothetical protein